ncbi:MAG: hypothetical protein ACI9UN_002553 [Granulosicoccus sp.]
MNRIYRSAYSVAQGLARVTERAYQFETDDKTSFFIASDNWDQSHAGIFVYRDDRFLPFEGVGAISHWQPDLPSSIRSFDYDTIADVMFHLDYTAFDGDRGVAEFALTDAHFSHLFRNRDVQISAITVYLKPKAGSTVAPPNFSLNDIDIVWDASLDIERPGAVDYTDKLKVGTVVGLNSLAKVPWQFNDGEGKLQSTSSNDLMILIHYMVTI